MKRCQIFLSLATLLSCTLATSTQAAIEVYAENAAPGDSFSNAGGTNTGHDFDGSGSGWLYNNVRVNGVVGINTTYAKDGNGSVYFSTPPVASPGTTNGKADIEFYSAPVANVAGNFGPAANPSSILGSLATLTSLSYEWYRDATSTNSAAQHPSLRLLVSNGASTGYLVYEGAYNGQPTAATDTWVGADIVGSNFNLWSTGSLPSNAPGKGLYTTTLSDWQSFLTDFSVIGVSSGVGSGWGQFVGAVDNITFGFSGSETTYNFEVRDDGVVPEPGTLAVWSALGLCGSVVAWPTRRRVNG
ncbi:hypothetical protein [Botrimarina mediterranea]|uniref:PEP-CTERM protein-sorting domain-containing protein n=1 Tax=Botrimarina mediterranea TaxID=2528022 RepID=A0A518K3Y8_9BACT|nr:hypothetical protein [Botrimarina mediterranea]QDV72489.1 hypothetical protein Spa11_06670 [Botrimarina mediterranea]